MRKYMRISAFTIFAVCLLFLTACERELTGAEADFVLSLSEPLADNLMLGLVTNDYAVFSRDFDSYMQESLPSDYFADWIQDIDSQLGNYLSREVYRVTQSDEFYVVNYRATFELEEPVIVGFAFHIKEPHSISHIWFETDQQSWAPEPPR